MKKKRIIICTTEELVSKKWKTHMITVKEQYYILNEDEMPEDMMEWVLSKVDANEETSTHFEYNYLEGFTVDTTTGYATIDLHQIGFFQGK